MPDPRNEIHVTPDTHRHRTTAVRALLAAGPVLVLCSLVLTGCGSSKGATPSATTTTTTTTTASAASASKGFAAYQSCLESHGVTLPQGRPSGGNGGAPPSGRPSFTAAQQKALDACADLRPAGAGGFGPGGGFGGGANSDNPAFAKFQSCLKQHGVDPTSAGARGSSDFQAAMTACRSLLPDQGAGGPSFGGGAPPGAGGGPGNGAAFAKFQACLKSHGVNTTAASQPSAKTQAALNACQKLLTPSGTQTTPSTSSS